MNKPFRILISIIFSFIFVHPGNSQTYFEFSCLTEITTDCDGKYFLDIADIDNDGDLDVMSTSYCGETVVWNENIDGQGTLGVAKIVDQIYGGSYSLEALDFDKDGDVDILIILNYIQSNYSEIVWYENIDGKGNYGSKNILHENEYFARKIIGEDIDFDGDMDIIYTAENLNGDCKILLNNDGVYQEETLNEGDLGSVDIIFEDLDNDTLSDIVAIGSNGIFVFKNLGNGEFSSEKNIAELVFGTSIKAYDLDLDDDLDLVLSRFNGEVILLENNGEMDFSFGETITIPSGPCLDVIGLDIDKNGFKDICISTYTGIYTVLSTGSISFFSQDVQYFECEKFIPNKMAISDMDLNGSEDVVACSRDGNKLGIFRNYSLIFSTNSMISSIHAYAINGKFYVKNEFDFDGLKIYNCAGQLVLISQFKEVMDISSLKNGVYFFQLIGNRHHFSGSINVFD